MPRSATIMNNSLMTQGLSAQRTLRIGEAVVCHEQSIDSGDRKQFLEAFVGVDQCILAPGILARDVNAYQATESRGVDVRHFSEIDQQGFRGLFPSKILEIEEIVDGKSPSHLDDLEILAAITECFDGNGLCWMVLHAFQSYLRLISNS